MSVQFVVKIVKLKRDEETVYGRRCRVFCGIAKASDVRGKQAKVCFETMIFGEGESRTTILNDVKLKPYRYLEETLNNAVLEIARNGGEERIPRWGV